MSNSIKQCTCGRSKTYPYCDNTHKIKKSDAGVSASKWADGDDYKHPTITPFISKID